MSQGRHGLSSVHLDFLMITLQYSDFLGAGSCGEAEDESHRTADVIIINKTFKSASG